MPDINEAGQSVGREMSSLSTLADRDKREAIAPKVVPQLKKMMSLTTELEQSGDPRGLEVAREIRGELGWALATFNDKETLDALTAASTGADAAAATSAKAALLVADWLKSAKDDAAQAKLVGQAKALVDANPKDDSLAMKLMTMAESHAANDDLSKQVRELVFGMSTPQAAAIKKHFEAEGKLRALENKPLVMEGVLVDGKKFSTADWKGKVIFVDFWATWCGPCRAELPRVKKAYADYHEKGLEVLGVSCDNDAADLTQFLSQNKDMPWPQLFDPKAPGWHPLATSYGINGIPTMFLIDKKGVVRTVSARENFEELIPKMLEEKAD